MANETKKFLYVKTPGKFKEAYDAGKFSVGGDYYDVIAFVKETGEIWSHGQAWGFSNETAEALSALIDKVDGTEAKEGKDGLISRVEEIEKLVFAADDDSETNVVDKLTEIIDWFKQVENTESGAQLISDVAANKTAIGAPAKDAEGEEGTDGYKPAQEATGLYKYIDEKTQAAEEGATLTVDTDNKSFKTGNLTYTMKINEDNTIGLYKYEALHVKLDVTSKVFEIDETATQAVTATIDAGTNKDTATISWSGAGASPIDEASTTLTASSPTSATGTVTVSDGVGDSATASCTLSFAPRIFWGWSTEDDLTTLDGVSGIDSAITSATTLSNKVITLSEAGYIYFAVPTSAAKTFYLAPLGSDSAGDQASLAGGMIATGKTFTKYTSSQKTYTIYRSTELKAAGNYRLDVK